MKIKKIKNQKGFTVLESIVAIMILSLAISGVFAAVQRGLSQSIIAKDEVKAFYLAQEAVEIIRNKRDNNQLSKINLGTGHWLAGISENSGDACYFGKICRADIYDFSLTRCSEVNNDWDSCPNLEQSSDSYVFSYGRNWPETNFKREIQLESISANEIAVIVRISWKKGLVTKEFKVKTILFDWI